MRPIVALSEPDTSFSFVKSVKFWKFPSLSLRQKSASHFYKEANVKKNQFLDITCFFLKHRLKSGKDVKNLDYKTALHGCFNNSVMKSAKCSEVKHYLQWWPENKRIIDILHPFN